jgi:ribosome-associated protein
MEKVTIRDEFIRLDQFLKFISEVSSGGEAKMMILEGNVKVNGEIAHQRGKKIRKDDIVEINGNEYIVE